MKCRECGGELSTARETVKYDASGLPVTLVNVDVRRCRGCGDWQLVLPRLEELHRVIAMAVIRKPTPLVGAEIRFLRKHMGWSGADFAKHMGCSAETVSRWENDRLAMGSTADRLLRTMVALAERATDYSLDVLKSIAPEKRAKPLKPKPLKVGLSAKSGWEAERRMGTNG